MDDEPEALARRLWPDAYGGARMLGERLLVSFARDATALGAELRRRTGATFRVGLVPRAESELLRLQERIWDERALWSAAGITVERSWPAPERGQVAVGISARDPAAAVAWFADRYGSTVTVDVVGSEATIESLAAIEGCAIGPDDRLLDITWQAGGGVRLLRIELDEHPEAVTVGAVVASGRVVTADRKLATAQARLRAPLSGRPLLDAESGLPIPPSPGRL